jgi:hypothetical protein
MMTSLQNTISWKCSPPLEAPRLTTHSKQSSRRSACTTKHGSCGRSGIYSFVVALCPWASSPPR